MSGDAIAVMAVEETHETRIEMRVSSLLAQMTIEEKIGQLQQRPAAGGHIPDDLRSAIRDGRVGSIINEVDVTTVNHLQWIAVSETRLRIPLLFGRDVIHGFKTVFPIPLGQAASWNPLLVQQAARVAALEAAAAGVNWTFAPMIDIGRDPRWGRVAEGFGEDPFLTGVLAAATVRGFQGDDMTAPGHIAACAKHFAGYGASESGRDYNTTNIPTNELRNVHLPPFKAAIDAGVASLMTSFSDMDGIPASANDWLLRTVLRDEWAFDGVVLSDWDAIRQLSVHGLTEDDRESAFQAASAGVDMEMASTTYAEHLASLVHESRVSTSTLDTMVANILRLKFRLGLFEQPYTTPSYFPEPGCAAHLQVARELAQQSVVLLTNHLVAASPATSAAAAHAARDARVPMLPLTRARAQRIAVIGPLADDPHEQLGTWIFDGDAGLSVTVLHAIREAAGATSSVRYARGLETTRSSDTSGFADAIALAADSDVVILVVGEEAILSGEAHCRADITLPGAQEALIAAVAATGTPVVLLVMAGRALALERVVPQVQAMLYAWHPGAMGGPAIADLLFGAASPCGKLPATLPRVTGQIPIYYAHKHTGKPPTPETVVHMDAIEPRAPQLSIGNTSFHLDVAHTPLFPFGHGLSYGAFTYENIRVSHATMHADDTLTVCAEVRNVGLTAADEIVQLYLRDLVGSVTRPVRELKAFTRIHLTPGAQRTVQFTLTSADLAFYGRDERRRAETGRFHVWVGGSSTAELRTEFAFVG